MSALVLDASAALAWCFVEERTPASQALLDRVAQSGAVVPPVWHLEVGQILMAAERRARASIAQVADAIGSLARLPIATDQADAAQRARDSLSLARQHRLTVFPACYLDLALRRALPLATRDDALQRAAREAGIEGQKHPAGRRCRVGGQSHQLPYHNAARSRGSLRLRFRPLSSD